MEIRNDDDMKIYLRRKKKREKIFTAIAIAWVMLYLFAILFSAITDTYRSHKAFTGEYLQWTETWYSTALKYFGYDYYHDKLAIVFNSSDNIYIYSDVPTSVRDDLRESDSPGTYYNENIKGRYKSQKYPDYKDWIQKSIYSIR